jgi:cupin fold WbuC family metalloprotein
MKVVDNCLLDILSIDAQCSERLRKNYNLHQDPSDPIQRLLNALEPDTYICPHKHENPDKRELFIPIRGRFVMVTFDNAGEIVSAVRLSENSDARIVEIEPGIWHTLVCEESGTIYFEIKDGPYNLEKDKNFASWAPDEQADGAKLYLNELKERLIVFENKE